MYIYIFIFQINSSELVLLYTKRMGVGKGLDQGEQKNRKRNSEIMPIVYVESSLPYSQKTGGPKSKLFGVCVCSEWGSMCALLWVFLPCLF